MGRNRRSTTRLAHPRGFALGLVVPVAVVTATGTLAASQTQLQVSGPSLHGNRCSATSLATAGGLFGQAMAANQSGVIVGAASDATGLSHAVLWRAGKPQ